MKNKKMIFSSALLSVLLGMNIPEAMAEVKIASQQYVDNKETSILKNITTNYATNDSVDTKLNNYYTSTEVEERIGEIVAGDLSGTLSNKEDVENKVQTITSDSTDKEYPSAAAVYNALQTKADTSTVNALDTRLQTAETNATAAKEAATRAETVAGEAQTEAGLATTAANAATEAAGLATTAAQTATQAANEAKTAVGEATTAAKGATQTATEAKGIAEAANTAVANKADKSNTLQGYGITDAYTKKEVDTALQNKADNSVIGTMGSLTTTENTTIVGAINEVDANVTSVDLAVQNLNTSVEKAQGDVDSLSAVVNSEESGLATKASQADLTDLEQKVQTNTTNIGSLNSKVGSGELSTTAQDLVGAVNELKTNSLTEGSLETINNQISQLQTEVGNKADSATTLKGYGITDAYTKTETDEKITTLAVPRPSDPCLAESTLCVLSIGTNGQFKWVNVTSPLE